MQKSSTFLSKLLNNRANGSIGSVLRWIHSGQLMTSQEVATALRPFIFIIHPDRFWKYPKEKNTNEVSLKKLNEFLDDKLSQKVASEQTVTFYMRNNETEQKTREDMKLTKVDIKLLSREHLNSTVHRILSQCSLSTDYLQKIGKQPAPGQAKSQASSRSQSQNQAPPGSYEFYRKHNEYYYNKEMFDEWENEFAQSKLEVNLTDWLKENYLVALKKLEASHPIHTELIRLKCQLIGDLKLVDLQWTVDWGASHIRGCLKNLSTLNSQYPGDLSKLNGKIVVFSRHSGVGLDGQIVLSIEDVRTNWLDLIRSIQVYDPFVASLASEEKTLSDLLRGISIVQNTNNVIAKKYVSQLRRFSTIIYEYGRTKPFPAEWPQSLSEYKLIVESDAGPLMLSTEGFFIVPASCPASLFVRFITENLPKATKILRSDQRKLDREKRIRDECLTAFGLAALEKDENIIPEQMIDFGERLLSMKDQYRPYLQGLHLRVSMYYSVLHDGQICVPFNFVPRP